MIAIHKPSDFKTFPGKILDAAKTAPQYVVRDGALLELHRIETFPAESKLDRLKGKSAWDALGNPPKVEIQFPRSGEKVKRITL